MHVQNMWHGLCGMHGRGDMGMGMAAGRHLQNTEGKTMAGNGKNQTGMGMNMSKTMVADNMLVHGMDRHGVAWREQTPYLPLPSLPS